MAESTLSVTINSLRREVGAFLGWGRTISNWTNTNLNDFDDISARALRMFYYPPPKEKGQPIFEWTFLRKDGTITLNTNTTSYDMPDDFGGTIMPLSVVNASASSRRRLKKQSIDYIRALQAMDSQTGVPRYFAVHNKAHTPATGQRWEMVVYPTPTATEDGQVLTHRYIHVPNILTNTNIYPVGGAQYSQVILAAHMAAAEEMIDEDPAGPYKESFLSMLDTAMRNDRQQKREEDKYGSTDK